MEDIVFFIVLFFSIIILTFFIIKNYYSTSLNFESNQNIKSFSSLEQTNHLFESNQTVNSFSGLQNHNKKVHKCGLNNNDLLPINKPEFNLEEIIKQMILLEDHLFQDKKRCKECITKHFYTIIAFSEEGITLDNDHHLNSIFNKILVNVRKYQDELHKTNDYDNIGTKIRDLRKEIMLICEPWITS